jgi:hypothetical protein
VKKHCAKLHLEGETDTHQPAVKMRGRFTNAGVTLILNAIETNKLALKQHDW